MSHPPRTVGPREWFGFLSMVLGMFMAILDIQIVSSSLSEIQAGLSASVDEISWVQTAYLIAEVVMIPLSGYLSRLLSTRTLFVISSIGFTLSSVACAFADSIGQMVLFRIFQGFIGGAMIPTVFATSFTLFPAEKRPVVTVMIGLVATMAPTLGPTLGGWITQSMSWHWLFLINVVPGILVTTLVWTLVHVDHPDWSLLKGFDASGLLLMAVFLGSLEYVVEEGPRHDWLENDLILTFTWITAISAILFFWRMLRYHHPIVDIRAFHDRNFAIGCLYSFIIGIGLYGSVYLLPLFMARVRGYNSLQIGVVMIVTGAFQFASAPVAGALSRKIDLRLMLAVGLCLFGTGLYTNSLLTAESSFAELFLPQAIRGFSLMFCFVPINNLALGTLPPHELKNASGLYNLMRNLGGAIGLAVINTILIQRMAVHMNHLGTQLNLARPVVSTRLEELTAHLSGLGHANPEGAAAKLMVGLAEREALVLTFGDAFLAVSLVFFLGLLLMPLVRKPQQAVETDH